MTPAPSATVLLLDGQRPPRIFFVKRHGSSAFMANAYVFPGGRLEAADESAALRARVHADGVERLSERMVGVMRPEAALALVICAVRETFEEAGVLLATGAGGRWPGALSEATLAALRDELHAGRLSFEALLERWDLKIDGDALVYFDHWITPPGASRRFEARFFVTRAPMDQRYSHDELETVDSLWLSAKEALARHEAGQLGLAPPTFWILRELRERSDAGSILDWAARRDVPAVEPRVDPAGGRVVDIPPRRGRMLWVGDHWVVE